MTYEFENVPVATAEFLSEKAPVHPGARALGITQDRLVEKSFIAGLGIEVAPFAAVNDAAELEHALAHIGRPSVLKTRRFGYDGKGQVMLREADDGRHRLRRHRPASGDPGRLRAVRARGLGGGRAARRRRVRRL